MPQFPLKIKLRCFAIAGVCGMPAMDALGHSRSHAHYGGCAVFASRNGGSADPNARGIFASFKSTIKVLMVLCLLSRLAFVVLCVLLRIVELVPREVIFKLLTDVQWGQRVYTIVCIILQNSSRAEKKVERSREEWSYSSEESQNFVDFSILLNSKY